MYHNAQSIAALQPQIDECKEDVRGYQQLRDHFECNYHHLSEDSRIDPDEHGERSTYILGELTNDIATHTANLNSLLSAKANFEASQERLWTDLCHNAYHYFNSCLGADFRPHWSLTEEECRALRDIIDQSYIISHTRSELLDLNSKSWEARHNQRRANQQAKVVNPRLGGDLSRTLNQARRERLQADLDQINTDVRMKEESLRLRKDSYSRSREAFYGNGLTSLLTRAGRIGPEAAEPDASEEPSARNTPNLTPDEQRQHTAESEHQPGHDGRQGYYSSPDKFSGRSDTSDKSLESQYSRLLDQLKELQQDYAAKRDDLEVKKLDHLITFTDSDDLKFRQLMETKLSVELETIGVAEQELVSLRRKIINTGGKVPRSPNEAPRSITGGGIRKRARRRSNSVVSRRSPSTPGGRDDGTGRLDAWRTEADDALARSSIPPSPGKSLAGSDLRSRSHTQTTSPDEELRRYRQGFLDESHQRQEETRGKYVVPAVDSEAEFS